MLNYTKPYSWNDGEMTLTGTSWAGISTSLVWKEAGICFDVAQGLPWAVNAQAYCITHGHQDHAGGIPYIVSQRALFSLPPGRFFMPAALVEPMHAIMRIWQEIEKHEYAYEFIGLEAGEERQIKPGYKLAAFATKHRVPCLGYTIFEERKHLRASLKGLPESEIAARSRRGEEVSQLDYVPMISFTGDTQVEFLAMSPNASQAKLLVTEVTYFGDSKSVSQAREWGHMHWDELWPRLNDLSCERLLLMHFSSRYQLHQIKHEIERRLPAEWRGRVDVFPR